MSDGVKKEFTVDMEYPNYTFVGWAKGRFKRDDGEMQSYCNIYVISPVSTFESEDYKAFGLKAEKKACICPDRLDALNPGDKVQLFFDDKNRVAMVALEG